MLKLITAVIKKISAALFLRKYLALVVLALKSERVRKDLRIAEKFPLRIRECCIHRTESQLVLKSLHSLAYHDIGAYPCHLQSLCLAFVRLIPGLPLDQSGKVLLIVPSKST